MGKIKKNFVLENLEVLDISTEGKAIAKHEGLVVFIDGAVPGDVVDVMVHRKKNSFAEGTVHQIKSFSKDRVSPVCEHFGTCGGCKWQNLNYQTQLQFKQKYGRNINSNIFHHMIRRIAANEEFGKVINKVIEREG